MFSARTRYIAAKSAIRYKKDGILAKSVFFDANNLRLFASFFYRYSDRYSHTNHRIICSSNQAHHFDVKLSYEEAFPINILGDEHIIWMRS